MIAEGLLVVDKPSGPTSHDVVQQARRLYGTRSVGHAGTLDPMASGVLVLLVGEATKLTPYIALDDKEYVATVAFGRSTDTLDALGKTTRETRLDATWMSADALSAAVARECERESQVPPAFSAISVGGERAHRKARRGTPVELAPRDVRAREIEVMTLRPNEVVLRVACSKGYYVRSLARDLSEALGVPGHLAALRRTKSGPYHLSEATAWPPPKPTVLTPLSEAAARVLPCATLTAMGAERARQGKVLGPGDFVREPLEAASPAAGWLTEGGVLVAIGARAEGGGYRVVRGVRSLAASDERTNGDR